MFGGSDSGSGNGNLSSNGSALANQVAFFTGPLTIGGDPNFLWDPALNQLTVNGKIAIGSTATFTAPKFFELAETITDFSAGTGWTGLNVNLQANSSIIAPTKTLTGANLGVGIPGGNNKTFLELVGARAATAHLGTGLLGFNVGFQSDAIATGPVTDQYAGFFQSIIQGSCAAATTTGISISTGASSAGSSTGIDTGLLINTPNGTGTITTHYGIKINDQDVGTTAWSIYQLGTAPNYYEATSEFHDDVYIDGKLTVTGTIDPTDLIFTGSGVSIDATKYQMGISSSGAKPLFFQTPTQTVAGNGTAGFSFRSGTGVAADAVFGGGDGGTYNFVGGTGGLASATQQAGNGSAINITGGIGGAGSAGAFAGNGGAIQITAGTPGATGGFGAGSYGSIDLVSHFTEVLIEDTGIGLLLPDNQSAALNIGQSSDSYFGISTSNGSESITIGNSSNNWDLNTYGQILHVGSIRATGGDFLFVQISPPVAATASLASPPAPGNVDNGDHDYKIAYVDTNNNLTEADSSSNFVTITNKAVNGQIELTGLLASQNLDVVSKNIYRRFNLLGAWKYVDQIPNSQTTYTDNIANADLGVDTAPSVNGTGNVGIDGSLIVDSTAEIRGDVTFYSPTGTSKSIEMTSEDFINPITAYGSNRTFLRMNELANSTLGGFEMTSLGNTGDGQAMRVNAFCITDGSIAGPIMQLNAAQWDTGTDVDAVAASTIICQFQNAFNGKLNIYGDGRVDSHLGGINTKISVANVATPPTDADLDSAFGEPADVGAGFIGLVNDNNGGIVEYIVWADGTNWFYAAGTKAL